MLLAFATRDLLRQDYKEEVMALRAAPGCAEGGEGGGAGGEGGGALGGGSGGGGARTLELEVRLSQPLHCRSLSLSHPL